MKRIASTLTLAALAAALLPAIGSADNGRDSGTPNSIQTLLPSTQTVLFQTRGGECRDAFARGISLRGAGAAGGFAGGNITVPPQVAQNAVWAELFWVVLDNQIPPATETFNGNALTLIQNGPVTLSPCWAEGYAFSYRADVLPFLQTGANALAGFPDTGALNLGPESEGATLVVVYASNVVDKEIVVLGGNDLLISFLDQYDVSIPVASGPGFGAELTTIIGDGQPNVGWYDEVAWNGTTISAPDANQGLDPGPGAGMWDTIEYGVSTGGANTVSLLSTGDCLNWVGTVFKVKKGGCVVPVSPSTWSNIKNLLVH